MLCGLLYDMCIFCGMCVFVWYVSCFLVCGISNGMWTGNFYVVCCVLYE